MREKRFGVQEACESRFLPICEEALASQTFHLVTSLQASLPPCELRLS